MIRRIRSRSTLPLVSAGIVLVAVVVWATLQSSEPEFDYDYYDYLQSLRFESLDDLADEAVDVVFTDPPYSSGARQSAQLRTRGSMRRVSV